MIEIPLYLYALFFVIAFIYGSVGHGGASGYIAVLAITGYFSAELVPVVLCLNILVSSIAFANYSSKGHFVFKLFWPFALTSIPMAFAGGYLKPDADLFYVTVGVVLLLMAAAIIFKTYGGFQDQKLKAIKIPIALFAGAVMGFLSGLVGVGGGIFLSPLILFLGWGSIRQISAVAALFILVNSASGLAGHLFTSEIQWATAGLLALPVIVGGFLGSRFGVLTPNPKLINAMLALVLIIAGVKMLVL